MERHGITSYNDARHPLEQKTKLRLEIAHVLFRLFQNCALTEQSAHIEKLLKIVRGTDQFRHCRSRRKTPPFAEPVPRRARLSRLGSASSLRGSLGTACGIIRQLRVRMGIPSALFNAGDRLLNQQANIAGVGTQHCSLTRDGFAWRRRPHPVLKARRRRSRTILLNGSGTSP